MLRRSSLGELSPIDITWGREVSGGPMSWTRLSHLTSEAQAWQLTRAPRPCQPHGFWEVWGLLTVFSGCSVGVVPHVDVFLMYLWGGKWSPCLIPPPSWRSSLFTPPVARASTFHQGCQLADPTRPSASWSVAPCTAGTQVPTLVSPWNRWSWGFPDLYIFKWPLM